MLQVCALRLVTCVFFELFCLVSIHDRDKRVSRGCGDFVKLHAITWKVVLTGVTVWFGSLLAGFPVAMAEHEADHRFTVEGSVCGPDGEPISGVEVIAKDTRNALLRRALTNDQGLYKVTLHLHNDNKGDPIAVILKDKDGNIQKETQVTAQFDPKDVHTERKVKVNFGVGCESLTENPPLWVLYGAGAAVLAGGAWVGSRLFRNRQRQVKSGRGGKR